MDQLRDLGFQERDWQPEWNESDIPVIEPYEDTHDGGDGGSSFVSDGDTDDVFYECADGAEDSRDNASRSSAGSQQLKLRSPTKRNSRQSLSPTKTARAPIAESARGPAIVSDQPRTYVPRGAPGARRATPDEPRQHMRTSFQSHRLSMPPSIRLNPPSESSRPLPILPHKSTGSQSSIAHRRHPAYPVEEWRKRTPSPVRSIREGLSTPPLGKRREGSRASSLMSAISSTWRRRGATSAEGGRTAVGQSGMRSTST